MVDPGCSGGGFDDMQDLHEQRVVIVLGILGRATLTNALKTIPQKGSDAECKGESRACQSWQAGLLKAQAGDIQDDWRGTHN